jgi:hypothetical protein
VQNRVLLLIDTINKNNSISPGVFPKKGNHIIQFVMYLLKCAWSSLSLSFTSNIPFVLLIVSVQKVEGFGLSMDTGLKQNEYHSK